MNYHDGATLDDFVPQFLDDHLPKQSTRVGQLVNFTLRKDPTKRTFTGLLVRCDIEIAKPTSIIKVGEWYAMNKDIACITYQIDDATLSVTRDDALLIGQLLPKQSALRGAKVFVLKPEFYGHALPGVLVRDDGDMMWKDYIVQVRDNYFFVTDEVKCHIP